MAETTNRRLQVAETEQEDETCKTFVMTAEDHTLGNSLRYMIMKNPDVKFCGYSIPHPSENKINFRIETKGVPAVDVLRRGFCELSAASEHVLATFEASVDSYNETHSTSMDLDK